MRYLSVCSGIEAATVAWHPLGWSAAAYSEIEPFPCKVLAHHYPNTPNLGDMTKFKEWPDYDDIDLLVGGTPCQSFSVAGLRKGLDDPRGNLMLTYLAIADKYKPKWIVWENVPGVLSSNGGRDFGTFLGAMEKLGYGFAYRVLDAQFVRTDGYPYAVPQRRRRVFVVGCLGDWGRAAAVLFDSESLRGNPPPRREAGKAVAGTIGSRTTGGGGHGTDFDLAGGLQVARSVAIRGRDGTPQIELGDEVANTILTPNGGRGGIEVGAVMCMSTGQAGAEIGIGIWTTLNCNHEAPIAFTARDYGNDATDSGATPTMRSLCCGADGHQSGAAGLAVCLPINMQAATKNGAKSPNMLGIGNDGDPSPTLGANDKHAVAYRTNAAGQVDPQDGIAAALNTQTDPCAQIVHQRMQVRRLMPRECERLQGFPPVIEILRIAVCIDHQNKSALAEIKCHRLQSSALNAAESEYLQFANIAEKNSTIYRGCGVRHVAVYARRLFEVRRLELLKKAKGLKSSVSNAEELGWSRSPIKNESFAASLVQHWENLEKAVMRGKVESPLSINLSLVEKNGGTNATQYGGATEEIASGAEIDANEGRFITLLPGLDTLTCDLPKATSLCSVISAISSCIQSETSVENFCIDLVLERDYTNVPGASDTTRYKALGNSMAVNVMQLIGERIQYVESML